jgi:hypothetical protein
MQSFAQACGKIHGRDIDASILNDILMVNLHQLLSDSSLSASLFAEYFLRHRPPPRGCTKPWESIFPCKGASVFPLVSDYEAWPRRSNEELLSCHRDRETAQLLFRLIWRLNLSSGATLRLSSSRANRSSQSVDADFGIGIAIAP